MQISNKATLDAAIIELKTKKTVQKEELVLQFKATRERLTPLNVVKDSFNELANTPGIQNTVLKTVAGIGVAFLSKKFIGGKSAPLLKKLLGSAAQLGITGSAINNVDKIKAYGTAVYKTLFKKKNKDEL